MEKSFVPEKTVEEKLLQIQSERESHHIQIKQLHEREVKLLAELDDSHYAQISEKAKKYDELVAIVDKFYQMDDEGEFTEGNAGLDSIGEAVATYLKYI